jgi:hypothetical protein
VAGPPRAPCPMARSCGGDSVSDDARVPAAAHLDSDPTNNRTKNLRALCQRCHMLHDRPHHLAQRWDPYRRRLATGDLLLGPYPALIPALTSKRTAGLLGYASAAASGPRWLSSTWCPDSMMGFRTAQSTIIPAVFDLAPNRQITANWQIRRHCAGHGEQPI